MLKVYGTLAVILFAVAAILFAPALLFLYGISGGGQARIIREAQADSEKYCMFEADRAPGLQVYNQAKNVSGFYYSTPAKSGCGLVCRISLLHHGYTFFETESDGRVSQSNLINGQGLFRLELVEESNERGKAADCSSFYGYRERQIEEILQHSQNRQLGLSRTDAIMSLEWPTGKCISVLPIDRPTARYVLRHNPPVIVKKIRRGEIQQRSRVIVDTKEDKLLADIVEYSPRVKIAMAVGTPESCKSPEFPITDSEFLELVLNPKRD